MSYTHNNPLFIGIFDTSEKSHFPDMPDTSLLYMYIINFNNILSETQNNYMQPDSYVMLYLACCKLLEREKEIIRFHLFLTYEYEYNFKAICIQIIGYVN